MRKINKPDVTNTDPEYWEGVLESHGLGLRPEPEETEEQDPTFISIEYFVEEENQ
jgi:hypothetical protein